MSCFDSRLNVWYYRMARSNLFVIQTWPSLAQILHITIFLSVLISHANMSSAAAVFCAVQGA